MAQINTIVGDLDGNFDKIAHHFQKAQDKECDLVAFPEMTISGYPAQDLWRKKYFVKACEEKILQLCKLSEDKNCALIIGSPTTDSNRDKEIILRNSAILIKDGKVDKIANKKNLPNYEVFDEKRYFEASQTLTTHKLGDFNFSMMVCADLWSNKNLFLIKEHKIDFAIAINSSPYAIGKEQERFKKGVEFSKKCQKPLIYLNQVGAQDSLVFDGNSFVLGQHGEKILEMKNFEEDYAIIEIEDSCEIKVIEPQNYRSSYLQFAEKIHDLNLDCEITAKNNYQACILGLRDYILKNGFSSVLLGMSGGIDSALVATMAVDALGSENVTLYALPSRFNSDTSMIDAKNCANNLGSALEIIEIEPVFQKMLETLPNSLPLTSENMQSRIRGNILMSLSNDCGALLLSTGNKSELACGYATLYGDMCGAFNPIKDLYKSQVYQLVNWRNNNIPAISIYKKHNIIPKNIIDKEPTAELRENQKDTDSLPDYDVLDRILYQIIEEEKPLNEIIKQGFAKDMVEKIAKLFYSSEYKRKQSVIGPKISKMAFDLERRYPITNKFAS